jgi:hypothetical protein
LGSPPSRYARACFHARPSDSDHRPSTSKASEACSRAPSLLLRVPLRSRRAPSLSTPSSPTRVSALLAASPFRVHLHRSIPSPCYVPSSGFLNLSTVFSAKRPTGFFHPAATSRVLARSGASPLVQPFFPHRKELPPCRSSRPSSPAETGCQSNAPRLRGFSPHEVALSPGLVLPAPRPAPLFEFPFPPGVRFPPCPPVPRLAPLMTFFRRDLRLPAGLARPSSASLDGDPDSRHLCPRQPARNFRAFLWFRRRSSSPG